MGRIFRWYNQNRRMFWIVLITIIMIYGLIRTLDYAAGQAIKNGEYSAQENYINVIKDKNYSVISGDNVNKTKANSISNAIDSFIKYCNEGNTEYAYNMLSKDCKNILYKTKEDFEKKYLNTFFKNKKTYSYKAWIIEKDVTVYRVELQEDALYTGNLDSKKVEDFYTVVNENGSFKLNINRYIGHEEINKEIQKDDIKIQVLSKDIYLENVIYNFEAINFSNNDIVLDTLKRPNTLSLVDSNGLNYQAATWELIEQNLVVDKRNIKNFSINFLKEYKPKYIEKEIVFNAVNLNYKNGEKLISIAIELQ